MTNNLFNRLPYSMPNIYVQLIFYNLIIILFIIEKIHELHDNISLSKASK